MRLRALFGAAAVTLLTTTAHAAISDTPADVAAAPIDDAGVYVAGPDADVDDVVVVADVTGDLTQATVHVATSPVADAGAAPAARTQPASRGVNLAGGADGDNCAVHGVGAPASGAGAAALALGLAISLTRRRRG